MISLRTILNPQSNIGQLLIILAFVFVGALGWEFISQKFLDKPCPPSTSINNDIDAGKKNPGINLNLNNDQSNAGRYTLEEAAKIINELPRRERKALIRD